MKRMTQKEFDRRWEKAANGPQKLELKASKRQRINLSLNTVVDNYAARLQQAAQAHALNKEDCDELCSKLEELRPLIRKAEKQACGYLTI